MSTLSRKQVALIHVAKNQLKLDDGSYRAILRHIGGVESSKDLDPIGFELVMQYMIALGFKSDFSKTFYGHRPGVATPAQINLIRRLWVEYTEGKGSDATLGKWLDRTFKVSAVRFLGADQAPKAITALLAMKAQTERKRKAV